MTLNQIARGTGVLVLIPFSVVVWTIGFTYQVLKDAFEKGREDANW